MGRGAENLAHLGVPRDARQDAVILNHGRRRAGAWDLLDGLAETRAGKPQRDEKCGRGRFQGGS
ncbi:MAG: hypothetical protein AMXMBFR83_26870 [Phycisphaerae bacterium]